MTAPLPLDDEQFADVKVLLTLNRESMTQLIESLEKLPSLPMNLVDLKQAISAGLDGNNTAGSAILQLVMYTFGWIRQAGIAKDEVLEGLCAAVEGATVWSEQELAEWIQIKPAFQKLLNLRLIRLSAAANDLSFDHENIYRRARILTEIRPIFDEPAENIEGAVIAHSLRLLYQTTGGPREMTIALDEMDVVQLAEQCDRALRKSDVARRLMIETADVPAIISGEVTDE